MNLESLLYAKTHEWTSVATGPDGRKIATVGLTAFALEALTDLVFIDLPPVGREVQRGERFGEVESVKAVSDLYSPVDGEVIAANADVAGRLDKLGEDPYDAGWLVKIRITDDAGLGRVDGPRGLPAAVRRRDEGVDRRRCRTFPTLPTISGRCSRRSARRRSTSCSSRSRASCGWPGRWTFRRR